MNIGLIQTEKNLHLVLGKLKKNLPVGESLLLISPKGTKNLGLRLNAGEMTEVLKLHFDVEIICDLEDYPIWKVTPVLK